MLHRIKVASNVLLILGVSLFIGTSCRSEEKANAPAASSGAQAAPVTSASSAATTNPKIDSKASDLLKKMMDSYKNLKSFSVTLVTKASGADLEEAKTTLSIKKPNYISLKTHTSKQDLTFICDGKNFFASSSDDKTQYFKAAAPNKFEDAINQAFTLSGGVGIGPLMLALTGQDVLPEGDRLKSLALGDTTKIDGIDVDTVTGDISNSGADQANFTFSIGKDDHLLHKVVLEIASKKQTLTEEYSTVKADPELADALFTFAPPPGAKPIEPPSEDVYYSRSLKPGGAPLAFTAKDMAGKIVTLDQYKGKALLLDFWATWCGPCLEEIPNVVAAYKKYKSQGFEIVGISLDQAGDLPKLPNFLKSKGMTWRQIADGKYWSNPIAKKYELQGIPFMLLIGRNGKIAAINPRGDQLAPAVEKALKAK